MHNYTNVHKKFRIDVKKPLFFKNNGLIAFYTDFFFKRLSALSESFVPILWNIYKNN